MIRNFVAGIVWGGVVGVVGLAVVSQLSPVPVPVAANQDAPLQQQAAPVAPEAVPPAQEAVDAAEPAPAAPSPAAPVADEPAAAPVATVPAAPNPEPAPTPAETTTPPAEAPAEPTTAAPAPATQEPTAPAEAAPADTSAAPPAPVETATAPATPEPPPSLSADAPTAPQPPVAASAPPSVAPAAEPTPQAANPPASLPAASGGDAVPAAAELPPAAPAVPAETLLTPAPDLQADKAPAQIVLDPVPEPAPAAPVPEATPLPEVAPLPTIEDAGAPTTLPPAPGLKPTVDGVAENTLPQIGDAPAVAAAAEPMADSRPIVAFARDFTNTSGKPDFAVVLRDTGAADLDRATLAALPFPVSFVIDPAQPDAAAHAAIYRAAGQEVVMLATGIPEGATAADLEQSFQANAAVLPEAVAVMDTGTAGFQDNRLLAAQVVPVIGAGGRGVLTFDIGLNAADQVARRDHVPAAVIFRDLDAEGEDTQKIRRYLDRAAFKAAQEGSVVVVGTTRPETIQALMEWTVEGRASSVELAPLTAVLTVQ